MKILCNSVDGLALYVDGVIAEDWEVLLDVQLEEALADKEINGPGRARSPLPPLFGDEAVVLNFGRRGYRWIVESADYGVQFQRPKRDGQERGNFLPAALLRVSAAALWRVGWREVIADVQRWAALVFESGYKLVPSRIDICADYQGFDVSEVPQWQFVTRADTIRIETEAATGEFRQLSAGRSNKVRGTIYRKTKELASSGKEWMRPIWRASGAYTEAVTVDRLEFQLGSEFLRERGFDTLDDVLARMGELWSYCLDWFSLRVPNDVDTNRSRWDVHPVWRAFRASLCGAVPHPGSKPKRQEQIAYRVLRHERAIIGHTLTLMHLHGETELSRQLDKAVWHFQQGGRDVVRLLDERARRLPGLHGVAV